MAARRTCRSGKSKSSATFLATALPCQSATVRAGLLQTASRLTGSLSALRALPLSRQRCGLPEVARSGAQVRQRHHRKPALAHTE